MSAVAGVLAVAFLRPVPRERRRRAEVGVELHSWWGPLSRVAIATRVGSVAVLVLAAAAGRIGSTEQLRNIAPALVIGVAWPLLVLGNSVVGPVWRWIDPWDSLARPAGRPTSHSTPDPERAVWPAALPALLWIWYLTAYPDALEPRSVGAVVAVYALVTVAGCLMIGRVRWLSSIEFFGLLFGWMARLPRRVLAAWRPPPGSVLVLGSLVGGLLFGQVRASRLWVQPNVSPRASLYATLGVAGFAGAGIGLLFLAERWARRVEAAGSVLAAVVPFVAGLALALSLARNRLLTSFQLLPILAGDPLGRGWDLFGTADWALNPDPLGEQGRILVQVVILGLAGLVGAAVAATRAGFPGRLPATVTMAVLVAGSIVAAGSQ